MASSRRVAAEEEHVDVAGTGRRHHRLDAAEQEPFGEDRLCQALHRRMGVSGGRLFDEVLAEVLAFTQGRGFADDVCMVGMEVRGES